MLAYVLALFTTSTVVIGCNVRINELMFIDNRAFPGGPNAWYEHFFDIPVSIVANAAYIIGNCLADGLLVRHALHGAIVLHCTNKLAVMENVYAMGLTAGRFHSLHYFPWVYR